MKLTKPQREALDRIAKGTPVAPGSVVTPAMHAKLYALGLVTMPSPGPSYRARLTGAGHAVRVLQVVRK